MIFLLPLASALTLEEAVARAAEVNPDAIVATLEQKQAGLEETQAWFALGLTPTLKYGTRFTATGSNGGLSWEVQAGVLDPVAWMEGGRRHAEAEAQRWTAAATTLDAQYAAAALYYEALTAEAGVESARLSVAAAQGTLDAATARVKAGLESELSGRAAQLELLAAQANLDQAQARLNIARARLSRALEEDIGRLTPPEPLTLPEAVDSPWLKSLASSMDAARWNHNRRIAGILPAGYAGFGQEYDETGWHADIGLTWTLEGIAVPFLKERQAALDQRIAQVQYDAVKRDLDLGLTESKENARAARALADAARMREKVAVESLDVGQARLSAGIASILEVLRLQDQAVQARTDRVNAELNEALALLVARKVAGVPW